MKWRGVFYQRRLFYEDLFYKKLLYCRNHLATVSKAYKGCIESGQWIFRQIYKVLKIKAVWFGMPLYNDEIEKLFSKNNQQ